LRQLIKPLLEIPNDFSVCNQVVFFARLNLMKLLIAKLKKDHHYLLLLLVSLLLYLPALFEPISYGDECIYLTLGNAFRKGFVFYRDIHDNKPPLLYLVAALSNGQLFWLRLIAIIWNSIHLFVIYKLVKKITKNVTIALIGGGLFIFLNLIFEGRIANGEIFMMMPATLAVYLLISRKKNSTFSFGLLLGSLFSLGFLFKIPVIFDLVAIIFAFFILPIKKLTVKEATAVLKNNKLQGIIAGFALPIAVSIGYYANKGTFIPYVRSALMQNIGYLSTWQGSNLGLIIRFLLVLIFLLYLFLQRKKIPFLLTLALSWFALGMFGALLSARPYPHYFIEIIPSLILIATLTLNQLLTSRKSPETRTHLLFFSGTVLVLVGSYFLYHFWWYPQIPYYKNFFSYITNQKNRQEYRAYWGEKTQSDYKLASFINQVTRPEDKIFAWGDAACTYAIADRLPVGRYTVNYHIYDFDGFEETLAAIKNNRPRLIIKLKDETRVWPELETYLENNYYLLAVPGVRDEVFVRRSE